VVVAPELQIEVYCEPAGERFGQKTVHRPDGSLASAAVPGFVVELNSLFET
jgi:hypothetical protein